MSAIVTVLRSGGDFKVEHVEALRDECRRYASATKFICLSDRPSVPGYQPLENEWPNWWSKIEAFKIPGPVVYMDLDTVAVGSLLSILKVPETGGESFTVLRDFNPGQRQMGSGLMAWTGDMSALYQQFKAHPRFHMERNRSPRWWGDQGFIERATERRTYWQDKVPGQVVSWKKHCTESVPLEARVVCFHGLPRPWDTGIRQNAEVAA